jgi:hypothetical protein
MHPVGFACTRPKPVRSIAVLLLLGAALVEGQGRANAGGLGVTVSSQPVGNKVKGRLLEKQPVVTVLQADGRPDVTNKNEVSASLGENPTGSLLSEFYF